MEKKYLMHNPVLFLALISFAVLVFGNACMAMPSLPGFAPDTAEERTVTTDASRGIVQNMPQPLHRPFDILGLVYATSVSQYEDGRSISSQEGIVIMLLRQAEQLGGNDILNLRVDESVVFTDRSERIDGRQRTITTRTVTQTGSALAIRYRD